jgi:SOS response regulatory protein OraA/RecX
MSKQQASKTASQPDDNKFASLKALRSTPELGSEQPAAQLASIKAVELEIVKATFYLHSHQPDDIDEWQLAIKRATGKRVDKSDLARYALRLLSKQFASKTAQEIYEDMQSQV